MIAHEEKININTPFRLESLVNIIKASGITGDADDSYLAVFHANEAYKIEGGTEEDRLIKIM